MVNASMPPSTGSVFRCHASRHAQAGVKPRAAANTVSRPSPTNRPRVTESSGHSRTTPWTGQALPVEPRRIDIGLAAVRQDPGAVQGERVAGDGIGHQRQQHGADEAAGMPQSRVPAQITLGMRQGAGARLEVAGGHRARLDQAAVAPQLEHGRRVGWPLGLEVRSRAFGDVTLAAARPFAPEAPEGEPVATDQHRQGLVAWLGTLRAAVRYLPLCSWRR